MTTLSDRIALLEGIAKGRANAIAVITAPPDDMQRAINVVSNRLSFDDRIAIGDRILAGALLDDDQRLFAELDALLPESILNMGLTAATFLEVEASF